MTVIAWDGRTLAADTRGATDAEQIRVRKLVVIEADGQPWALACWGSSRAAAAMTGWAESGAALDSFPALADDDETCMFAVRLSDGLLMRFDGAPAAYTVRDCPTAFGSGGSLARGALAMGADAVRAVEIACAEDGSCGLPVEFVEMAGPLAGEVREAETVRLWERREVA